MRFGATVVSLETPDRDGKLADVVLGLDDAAAYERHGAYFGATVGRVANRIRGGQFSLEGKTYTLNANGPPHHLHGGVRGFSAVLWDAEPFSASDGPALLLRYVSEDGEEGYPGRVQATTTYTLTHDDAFRVEMEAVTDQTTIVNLAHHSYWNLAGCAAGLITEHELTLHADSYTPGDPLAPTGVVKPVQGSPFDFTTPKPIGRDLRAAGGDPVGFDLNYIVRGEPNALRPVAKLRDPRTGRVLWLEANQPGVQLYSGNFLNGALCGKGATYVQYSGLCLETQKFPNAINVPAWRDQVILRRGEIYRHVMIHRFGVE